VESCSKCVEEASAKDGIVRVVHVHHIKGYVFCSGIVKATKRYDRDMEPTGSILLPPKPYN
jgi:hypothetical protein